MLCHCAINEIILVKMGVELFERAQVHEFSCLKEAATPMPIPCQMRLVGRHG